MTSIRRYLLKALALALVIGSLLTAAFTLGIAMHEINELYDNNMKQMATTLLSQVDALPPRTHLFAPLPGDMVFTPIKHEEEFLIQVWGQGTLLYSSHPAIAFPLQAKPGHATLHFDQQSWHLYLAKNDRVTIQVAQPRQARHRFIREMVFNMLYPILAQIPIIGLFIWLAVGRSFAPMQAISQAIKKRSATSLEPLTEMAIPVEIRPMVESLNGLLYRLNNALETQQRFTADAAHELRTPLAVIKLQLGILARTSNDPATLQQAIDKLHQGVDRASHMAQQLLTLARLEPEYARQVKGTVDLAALAASVVEQYIDMAHAKRIDLGVSRGDPVLMHADSEGLRVLLNNLVDNAIRYTPEGGRVDVAVYPMDRQAVMEVKDNGIGIAEQERAHIFDRFYRVTGTATYGTGLGLSIVKHIVDHYQGRIVVGPGIGGAGTGFTVTLPHGTSV